LQGLDFWMRDIMPTFALCSEGAAREAVAIDWNFNGWGAPHRACGKVLGLADEARSTDGIRGECPL
jgi:agmatine deiminase